MKNEEVHNTEDRSSTEIASDIRERRNRMDATLDELSNQFTVRSIVNSPPWCRGLEACQNWKVGARR
jgi:hypothetical protein